MFRFQNRTVVAISLFAMIVLVVSVITTPLQLFAWLPLQSALPIPNNPNFIFSSNGGRRVCGSEGSPVSLDFSKGFTTEGGAEVRCDPNPRPDFKDIKALNSNLFDKALSNRGYLIGIYPSVSFTKPLTVLFEIDSSRIRKLCKSCAKVMYYDKAKKTWAELPTTIDLPRSRIFATITQVLPGSDYPGFPDRMLVALFLS